MNDIESPSPTAQPIEIGGVTVPPGQQQRIDIDAARLPTGDWLSIPVVVVNGNRPGPTLWMSAALHGDEINGVETIRRVLGTVTPETLCGTLIAVPIVNIFGFIEQSRYLPDRRDLNRCFPGSRSGSLASRLASLFMREIVSRSTHGIDLHTGSDHRTNLPQIRADLEDDRTRACAEAFGVQTMMHAATRDGSLRQAAFKRKIPMLLFEGGEPLRFDEEVITAATEGSLRVMNHLGMCDISVPAPDGPTIRLASSSWVRARQSGILRLTVTLGDFVAKGSPLGIIADAFGEDAVVVKAPFDGLVIGKTLNPLVSQGDGMIHIGKPLEVIEEPGSV